MKKIILSRNKIKKVFFFLLIVDSNLFCDVISFQNTYIENGKKYKEEFVLSKKKYRNRNKEIIIKDNVYYIKKNTLLEINPKKILKEGGFILKGKRQYYNKYYLFVKSSSSFLIQGKTQQKKIHLIVDHQAPYFYLHFFGPAYWKDENKVFVSPKTKAQIVFFDQFLSIKKASILFNDVSITSNEIIYLNVPNNSLLIRTSDELDNNLIKRITLFWDQKAPKVAILVDNKIVLNESYKVFNFKKESLEVNFEKEKVSDQIYYHSGPLKKESFKLFESLLKIKETTHFFYYALDPLGNKTKLYHFLFKKEKKVQNVIKIH